MKLNTHTKPTVWLSSPHLSGAELSFVEEAFATNWVAPLGPHVDAFETELAGYVGRRYAAVLSSGTAAIHLSLVLLGVSSGDVVLCQSFTFAASASPILYQGATPVFIDSEPDTWNLCPEALETAIRHYIRQNKKPKAVVGVHLYGMPARMDEILALCERYDIPFVEDAAEALGASYAGRKCGNFGACSILSFNGNKIITTSGGGALLADDEALIQKAKFLATQARDAAPHYQHSQLGYNYRMSNVLAGIGRGQLAVIEERVAQRRHNFEVYQAELGQERGVSFLLEPDGFHTNRWLSCLLINPAESGGVGREDLRLHLAQQAIESRPLWKPMHMQPLFQEAPYFGGQVAERLFEQGLCLPSGSNLTDTDRTRVVEGIREVLKR